MQDFKTFIAEADAFYKNHKIISDTQLEDFIRTNCSDVIRVMTLSNHGWFYRGFNTPIIDPKLKTFGSESPSGNRMTYKSPNDSAFILNSQPGREPRDSTMPFHTLLINLIKQLPHYNGVNRDNCFFLTTNYMTATLYGEVHLAIPVNGFKFLYSTEIEDMHMHYNNNSDFWIKSVFPYYRLLRKYINDEVKKSGVNNYMKYDYPFSPSGWLKMYYNYVYQADPMASRGILHGEIIQGFIKKEGITLDQLFSTDIDAFQQLTDFKSTDLKKAVGKEIMVTGQVLFVPEHNKVLFRKHPNDFLPAKS